MGTAGKIQAHDHEKVPLGGWEESQPHRRLR